MLRSISKVKHSDPSRVLIFFHLQYIIIHFRAELYYFFEITFLPLRYSRNNRSNHLQYIISHFRAELYIFFYITCLPFWYSTDTLFKQQQAGELVEVDCKRFPPNPRYQSLSAFPKQAPSCNQVQYCAKTAARSLCQLGAGMSNFN